MTAEQAPTERQTQILRVLRGWIADHGEGPTVRELGRLIGVTSTGTVSYHLARLEEQGLISRGDRSWRSLRLRG